MQICLLGTVTAGVGMARSAEACSVVRPPAGLFGYPNDGAEGVPTDVVLVYDFARAQMNDAKTALAASYTLSAAGGSAVRLAVRHSQVSHIELVPAEPLTPGTRYTLNAIPTTYVEGGRVPVSLSFTTGAGPEAAEPPTIPTSSLRHYELSARQISCADPSPFGSCISHPDAGLLELLYLDGINRLPTDPRDFGAWGPYLHEGAIGVNYGSTVDATYYQCFRLRTRSPNGRFSEPLVLCGENAPRYSFADGAGLSCQREGLTLNGLPVTGPSTAKVRPTDAGTPDTTPTTPPTATCSYGAADPAPISYALCLTPVAAALYRRRRRRTPSPNASQAS